MSLKQLLSVLRARWLVVVSALALTVAMAVIISLVLPKKYTSTASVIVDNRSPDPMSGMLMPGAMLPGYMATQIDVLTSERVTNDVIQQLRLGGNAALREQWQEDTLGEGDFNAWLSDLLLKNLDVKPSKESSVINVSYTATDPRFAAAMVNAFVQGYINTTLELRVEPAKMFTRLFDEQTEQARQRIEAAQTKLSEFQRKNNLLATDERLDVETARLNELSAQLVALQSLTAEAMSRNAQATNNSPEVLANAVVSALRAELSREEARMKELNARLGRAHPQVLELQANINELKARIDLESQNVRSSVNISSEVSKQRENQVRASLEAQREKVLKLKALRDQAAVLSRDVEGAQRAFDGIQNRFNQTALESQSNQTNVSLLKRGTPSAKPSSPNMVLNTVLAVFIGLLIGVGVAMWMELIDRRVRSTEDVMTFAGGLMLGTMPLVAEAARAKLAGPSKTQPRLPGAKLLPDFSKLSKP